MQSYTYYLVMRRFIRLPLSALVYRTPGSGPIWNEIPFNTEVIPAKAGIHSPNLRKCAVYGLDSRFRGNDGSFECARLANNTSTELLLILNWQSPTLLCQAGRCAHVPGLTHESPTKDVQSGTR